MAAISRLHLDLNTDVDFSVHVDASLAMRLLQAMQPGTKNQTQQPLLTRVYASMNMQMHMNTLMQFSSFSKKVVGSWFYQGRHNSPPTLASWWPKPLPMLAPPAPAPSLPVSIAAASPRPSPLQSHGTIVIIVLIVAAIMSFVNIVA